MTNEFSSVKPVGLKCEYKINPTGIDTKKPLLSWFTEYDDSSYQSAYRILISSSILNLNKEIADVWDSAIVKTSESSLTLYASTLTSNTTYFWKVMIWNENDEQSRWSEPAYFSTGLFEQSEWKAKWIRHNYSPVKDDYLHFVSGEDKWIWYPLKNEERFKHIILKKEFITGELKSARILITADEKFQLLINDKFVTESDDKIFSWSRPKHIDVLEFLKEGKNEIKVRGFNSYVDEPGVLLRLELKTSSGLNYITSGDAGWESSFEGEDNFVDVKIIRSVGDKPYRIPETGLTFNPAAYFKKEFSISKKIVRAFAYCSALGLYHLELNNQKVSEGNLLPGWTDFNKRVLYNVYEVTSILSNKNRINIILADGYYSGYCGWEKGRGYYGKYPALIFQLIITYEDGSNEIIASDESWVSSEGPIREADILMGEYYDSNTSIDDYKEIIIVDDVNPLMTNYKSNVVKKRTELKPMSLRRFARNDGSVFIIDYGQNFAGYVRIKLNNQKAKVVLRFAEVLNNDGTLYFDNIRMARATDTFISKGEGEEIWEPLFTYHGFRYVEVRGLDDFIEDTVMGISINSLEEQTGYFKSSNEKLNKLFECILWNQRSNYIDIPTDCPQRDERFGWTGDAIIEFPTAAFNYDMSSFYSKWFQIFYDDQKKDGSLPPFSPAIDMGVGPVFYNSAGWADAGIIALYEFYKVYNDKIILEHYYDKMKLFINSLIEQSDDFILPEFGYGDWLSGEETSKSFIATAFFAYDVALMIKISKILQRTDDAIHFNELLRQIKYSFKQKFLSDNYELMAYTQTAAVLSLHFNLLGIEGTEKAKEYLVNDIIKHNFHATTGFLGLSFLMPVLSSLKRNDIAWKVLTNNTFPSWFYMIDLGATTLWERWDAYHPEKGFFDPTMNSFNHCSLGCVGEWLFTGLAGIKSLSPGFKKIRIEPYIPSDLHFVEASYKSICGIIKSNWKKEDSKLILDITVPFNTYAEIVIPVKEFKIISKHSYIEKENFIEVGSGNYIIEYLINQDAL